MLWRAEHSTFYHTQAEQITDAQQQGLATTSTLLKLCQCWGPGLGEWISKGGDDAA